jgi:sugar phosphate isomerase/epimerase
VVNLRVVDLVTAYLDECAASGVDGTLVGVLWYVDAHFKSLPTVEEVNEALRRRPVRLLGLSGSQPFASSDDISSADREYRKQVSRALKGSK